ncbi:nuclear transport factor 2 family protein [Adhaeribacter rhizoryzae]|uniref:Nuclear transport factor 2 family protein n=1 Tax=Adhaeribacter rhizoryzae TaxID=2607907 RepID=A0A5M6D868_9BACT|nr:nuclear transport factor 2 family protein [Adhaeribacter rhizoryzae]KAA5542836.1 nuclear transport factor 2 family protein [Adhaeribacter rhizoryzae]
MTKIGLTLLFFSLSFTLQAQTIHDEQAVRKAILDYVESFYQADTTKVYASVHPELAKRGYYKREGVYRESKMSFAQMVKLSQRWNKTTKVTSEAPKEINIFEIKDKIAVAKLRALWGTDYFHLAKLDGKWQIVNVIWQD